jgi:hypothetical protein
MDTVVRALTVVAGLLFPSPLVGEGGSNERSEFETGEGYVSADGDPSSGADFVRATFSHKGRREESNPARDDQRAASLVHLRPARP